MNRKTVVLLAFPGVTLFDIAGPADVFDIASQVLSMQNSAYNVIVASITGGLVRASSKISLDTQPLSTIDPTDIDTLIVTGGGPPHAPPVPEDLVKWLRANHTRAKRICAICTGAFLVADAGIAESRRITTHWQAVDLLQHRYPGAKVDKEAIFVKDQALWSSAGFTAGIDLSLALIEEDYGHDVAIQVARLLVMFLKRPGDQPQFSAALASQSAADSTFAKLHAWISSSLNQDLRIPALAEQARMAPRTFSRRYKSAVGRTPSKTVELLRLEAACRLLREADTPLKCVAKAAGFGDEQTLRRVFLRHFGVVPHEYCQQLPHSRGQSPAMLP